MYVGELKYSITIDGTDTNVVTVPKGETVIDLTLTGIDEINTYYKLLYTYTGTGITVTYFDKTQNTSGVSTTYDLPGGSLTVKGTKKLKLKINNISNVNRAVTFRVSGGYSTNTLSDVEVPSGYNQITLTTQYTNTYFCTASGTLTDGFEYTNDGLTYRYKYQTVSSYDTAVGGSVDSWAVMHVDGWGVRLTNKSSTSAVTSKLCTYINNKPIKSMAYAFWRSQASTINLLYFDTHNVFNMSYAFASTSATSIYNISNINTSSVTNMSYMFNYSKATSLNLSSFDTSKVTNMSGMFYGNTSSTLNISGFDTSSVTNMASMFGGSTATSLDLSSFNTSKVTNMDNMFDRTAITELKGLNKFNTSNVTSMSNMFIVSQLTTLDLSSFDTSNVTDMSRMFEECAKLTTIYVSDKFVTDNVTNSSNMFKDSTKLVGENGTKYNSSYLDKTYARIDKSGTPGYFTLKN